MTLKIYHSNSPVVDIRKVCHLFPALPRCVSLHFVDLAISFSIATNSIERPSIRHQLIVASTTYHGLKQTHHLVFLTWIISNVTSPCCQVA